MKDANHHANNYTSTLDTGTQRNKALHTQMARIERLDVDSPERSPIGGDDHPRKIASVFVPSSSPLTPVGSLEYLGDLQGSTSAESSKRKLPRLGSSLWNLSQNNNSTRHFSSGMPVSPRIRRSLNGQAPPLYQGSAVSLEWSSSCSTQSSSNSLTKSSSTIKNNSCLFSPTHGNLSSLRNERMVIQIAQRSSSKEVKGMLTQLAGHSLLDEEKAEAHCGILAQLVSDSYYQVVISKYGGPQILCHVMKSYPNNTSILESCCTCLERMPHHPHLQSHGGEALKACLEAHPRSIHVQSAACQALSALLDRASETLVLPVGLDDLVHLATQMYLTPAGRRAADRVCQLLSKREEFGLLIDKT